MEVAVCLEDLSALEEICLEYEDEYNPTSGGEIQSTTAAMRDPNTLAVNTWGWYPDSLANNTGNLFSALPSNSGPYELKKTSSATLGSGDTTTISFGVNVDIKALCRPGHRIKALLQKIGCLQVLGLVSSLDCGIMVLLALRATLVTIGPQRHLPMLLLLQSSCFSITLLEV